MIFPLPNRPRPKTRTEDDDLRQQYGVADVFRMHSNENIIGVSPKVIEAVKNEAANLAIYPTMGDERVRDALAVAWGGGLTPDHFYTSCSGYEALELVARAFVQAGDDVIVSHPTFGVYNVIAQRQQANLIDVPLSLPEFKVDVAALLAAVTPNTSLLILCNPNNPTGTMGLNSAEMDHLVENLPDHVLLLSDEVYIQYVTDPAFPDSLKYVKQDKNIVLVHSFSKAYALAGLRVGYGIAPTRIANYIAGLHRGYHQNSVAQAACVAALQDTDHLTKTIAASHAGMATLAAEFDRLGLSYLPTQTNFHVVKLPISAEKVAQKCLEGGVMVKALKGAGLDNCLRVSTSTPAGNQKFIEILERALKA